MKITWLFLILMVMIGCKKQPKAQVEQQVARLNSENKSKCAYWRVGGTPEQPVAVFDQSKCQFGKELDKQ